MLFHTFDFLLFFAPLLTATWVLARRPVARAAVLLGASYFFYMAGPRTDPLPAPWYFVGLLIFSTALDFVCALRIRALDGYLHGPPPVATQARSRRNAYLALSLVGNLGLLGYFKYTNFLLGAFADVARGLGVTTVVPHLELLLPIGISFYTFQSLSYTIDVWRRRITPERSLLRFALYVAFFPQLVAGPIVRATELLPQLRRGPRFTRKGMDEGMFRIAQGLTKKVLLGDFIAARLTDPIFSTPGNYSSLELLLALYAFTVQLYADFSGYTDMAIGVGRLLGFELPENFDRPYQSRNLGQFWRRWHMTLSTWLRDYLYFPLGGSRAGPLRAHVNLWVTMFLVGMWHGASWNFVIYSNLHAWAMVFNRWNRSRARALGATQALTRAGPGLLVMTAAVWAVGRAGLELSPSDATTLALACAVVAVVVTLLPETGTRANTAVHVFLTFHFTVLSRIFFRADSLETSRDLVAGLVTFDGLGIRPGLVGSEVWGLLAFGLAYHFTPRAWVDQMAFARFRRLPGPVLAIAFGLICIALFKLVSSGPRAFIYFQF